MAIGVVLPQNMPYAIRTKPPNTKQQFSLCHCAILFCRKMIQHACILATSLSTQACGAWCTRAVFNAGISGILLLSITATFSARRRMRNCVPHGVPLHVCERGPHHWNRLMIYAVVYIITKQDIRVGCATHQPLTVRGTMLCTGFASCGERQFAKILSKITS